MPRTPKDAGLIGVALKRKQEYTNTHKPQLINPEKLFKILSKMKKSKNPHYQFYDDYDAYQERCKEVDPSGYNVVFNEDSHEEYEGRQFTVDETILENPESDQDETDNKEDAEELNTKDPVKKYQFKYNESLFMIDKYPEIRVPTDESVSIAPGEGQIPKDIMTDDDWDIKAFPQFRWYQW